jgi:hypothetical protein
MENSHSHSLPERRKHVRYFPDQETFAALGGGFSKVGRIINIGMGGLAFEYTVFHETEEENVSVEIFLTTGTVHLHHVSCKVIVDEGIDTHIVQSKKMKLLSNRLCRIQFTEMPSDREGELESFISNYTSSRSNP